MEKSFKVENHFIDNGFRLRYGGVFKLESKQISLFLSLGVYVCVCKWKEYHYDIHHVNFPYLMSWNNVMSLCAHLLFSDPWNFWRIIYIFNEGRSSKQYINISRTLVVLVIYF